MFMKIVGFSREEALGRELKQQNMAWRMFESMEPAGQILKNLLSLCTTDGISNSSIKLLSRRKELDFGPTKHWEIGFRDFW